MAWIVVRRSMAIAATAMMVGRAMVWKLVSVTLMSVDCRVVVRERGRLQRQSTTRERGRISVKMMVTMAIMMTTMAMMMMMMMVMMMMIITMTMNEEQFGNTIT